MPNLDPIYVDENPVTDQSVMLNDADTPAVAPNTPLAVSRTQKTDIGLGPTIGMPKPEIFQNIASGQEQRVRDKAASQLNFDNAMRKQQMLIDLANRRGRPLTQEEADTVLDPFSPKNKPVDPGDVIERAYAQKYVSSANTAAGFMKDTVLDHAVDEIPEELNKKMSNASELITKMEYARTLSQNIENEISQQGWVPYLADQAKTMLQPYNEVKMRGLYAPVGAVSGGLLLGDNMKAQADALFDLPMDDYKKALPKVVEQLRKDNPTLAKQFVDYVIGVSSSDRKLNNMFTILAPLDAAQVAKGGVALARKISVNNRASTAFKDIVKSAQNVDKEVPAKAVMEEGAGDVSSAAATRAGDHVDQAMKGSLNPVQDVKESLTSNFRLDGDLIDSSPGNLSREQLTRLKDGFYRTGSNLYDTIMNAVRVNRTPVPLASEDAFKAYQASERGRYPGLNNALLDIGSPLYERASNTYWIPHTFGNIGGDLFANPETALNFAKRQGFADARIIEDTGRVETSPAQMVGTKTDIAAKVRLEKSIPETEAFLKKQRAAVRDKTLPEKDRKAIQESLKGEGSIPDILKRDKANLADINKRVTFTAPVIEQSGLGYKFTILRPYTETDSIVRSWLIKDKKALSTSSAEGFTSWKNSVLGWIRGADDTLAYNESLQRKVATYTQSLFRQWAKDETAKIEAISNQTRWYKPQTWYKGISNKQMFNEFNDTLKFAKTADDPITGDKGYFFKTPGELQDHYQRYYNRMPSFAEHEAYFAHVKLVEGNRVLSEIAEFRNRARLGTEQHRFFVLAGGKKVASDYIDGIHQKNFPGGSDQILIMGERQGDERLYNLGANNIPPKDHARYKQDVEQGLRKVIRIYDPDSHPLEGFSNVAGSNRVRYVLTSDTETKPLDFNHVNRRGGGHFDVDADLYVKQARMVDEIAGSVGEDKRSIFKRIYTGDNTLMPIENRAMGDNVAGIMNKINKAMIAKDVKTAQDLSAQLGIDWKEMEGWYSPSRGKKGEILPPRIDMHEPFRTVSKNKKISDIDKELINRINAGGKDLFKDGTIAGSDAQQFKVAYNQARDSHDLMTVRDEGTAGNPLYKYVPAEYVDPIPTMNRALNRAIQSTFMDDYKIYAVEHWLQEAMPHMKEKESMIRSSPFYHFNNANLNSFLSDMPEAIKWNLMSNKKKISDFLGTPNKTETAIHGITQLLTDAFYKKFGPEEGRNIFEKSITIAPLWAISKLQDPVSVIRSLAFNAKLGLFSIPQLLVQAQTYTSILALEPRRGMAGTYAAFLHQWSRVNANPEVLKSLDNYASKLNMFGSKWKTGEWMEARNELNKTGFEHVGGEYQLADDQMQAKFIKNEWNNFLDAGQFFFREGEKSTRLGAWYTAFREFRDINPTKAITDADRAAILNKADLLTTNMSRASASSLHSGVLSLSTQFLSYQLRMAEMFIGKRLGDTRFERNLARARLLTMYSAMYGIPSAIGVTGYPFGDSIRQAAINRGYVVGDKFLSSLAMEGIPALTMAMITGGGDISKGNFYNVGDRYGSQGFTQFREAQRSDNTLFKIFGGAGLSTFASTIANLDPFWKALHYMVTDDEEGNTFKLTGTDFVNIFTEVSSVDATKRWYLAMNTAKWFSKNGQYMDDVSKLNATFMAATGLKPQGQDDVFSLKNIKDTEERVWKDTSREATKLYQRGVQAVNDNDPDTAKILFTNARARMISAGIPLDMRSELYAKASRGYEKMIDTSKWNWANKNVPAGQEDVRQDALTRQLDINDKRSQ